MFSFHFQLPLPLIVAAAAVAMTGSHIGLVVVLARLTHQVAVLTYLVPVLAWDCIPLVMVFECLLTVWGYSFGVCPYTH